MPVSVSHRTVRSTIIQVIDCSRLLPVAASIVLVCDRLTNHQLVRVMPSHRKHTCDISSCELILAVPICRRDLCVDILPDCSSEDMRKNQMQWDVATFIRNPAKN